MVGISKTEVGDSLDLLLGKLAALGFCQPDGTSITTLAELEQRLGEMTEVGEAVCVDGLATRVQPPHEWGNQKALYDAKRHAHTAQGVALSSVHVTCCGWMGLARKLPRARALGLSGLDGVLDAAGVAVILDRGFRGMATLREHWHTPVGDRRTKDRLGEGQRAFNRVQAGCGRWWSRRSPTWPAPGRCGAGAGCCTGSGLSSGPLAR